MYIDCVMSTTFHFVFETNNNDEDKEFEKFRSCLQSSFKLWAAFYKRPYEKVVNIYNLNCFREQN